MSFLLPCPACDRHVKPNESVCPFCGTCVEEAFANAPESFELPRNLSRAAMIAMFGSVACASDPMYGTSPPIDLYDAASSGYGGSGGEPPSGRPKVLITSGCLHAPTAGAAGSGQAGDVAASGE